MNDIWNINYEIDELNCEDLTIIFIDYNSSNYTKQLIKSLKLFGVNFNVCKTICFDNSTNIDTSLKSYCKAFNVEYISNKDNVFDIYFPNIGPFYSSIRHSNTMDFIIRNIVRTKYVLFLDNDIIVTYPIKNTFEDFKNLNCLSCGFKLFNPRIYHPFNNMCRFRLCPYYFFINVDKFNEFNCTLKPSYNLEETLTAFYLKNYDKLKFYGYIEQPIDSYAFTKLFRHYGHSSFNDGFNDKHNEEFEYDSKMIDFYIKEIYG